MKNAYIIRKMRYFFLSQLVNNSSYVLCLFIANSIHIMLNWSRVVFLKSNFTK